MIGRSSRNIVMHPKTRDIDRRPLRVMMIAPTSFFGDYGGHIRILEETRILQELGHKVAIVTYSKGTDLPDIDIRRTSSLPWHAEYEVGSSRHKLAFDLFLLGQSLIEFRKFRPHILHGHMHEGALIGGFISKLFRIPLVFDFQGSLTGEMIDHGFLNPEGRVFPWALGLEKFIDRRLPSAILTSSIRASKLLQDEFGVEREKIHPLPDCADTVRFDPALYSQDHKMEIRRKLGIPPDRLVVAYLGLLADYQGTHHLVQVAANLAADGHNIHFLVMGYPSVQRYRALAESLGVSERVTFTGKMQYSEAPAFLAVGDVAVAPKTSTTEGSGKLLNYMAMAQPIVAFDTPVQREYLGELGVYAPAGDVAGFTMALSRLIGDPHARNQLGKLLRQRAVEEYSWHRAGRQIESVYRDLTS
jgi:glycosyltransferase involved in cell wall biosynthesis